MNYRVKTLSVFISTLLLATAAVAAKPERPTLHDRLVNDEGMTQIADGLYADVQKSGAAYVATSASGQRLLAEKIREKLPLIEKRAARNPDSVPAQQSLSDAQKLLRSLDELAGKDSSFNNGNCQSGASIYASASASGGTTANASAAVSLDFGPVTPTSNYANANNDVNSQTGYGVGYGTATASVSNTFSCFSDAYASVTCPNEGGGPQVAAWAYSQSNLPRCRYF